MKIRLLLSVVSLFVAASSFAALSKEYNDFAKGPTQYLLTRDEQKQWAAIATDAQANAFIELFWARRDPTPATPQNEFRDMIRERIKVADIQFTQGKVAGSATDRGKVFIVLGSPTSQRKTGSPGRGTVQTPQQGLGNPGLSGHSIQDYSPKTLWTYEQGKVDLPLGQPVVEVGFVDQYASNEWKMERVLRTDYATVFDRVAASYIKQPGLTEVPQFAAAPAAGVAGTTAPAPIAITTSTGVASAFKSDALRAAVDDARAKKASSDTLFLTWGEFVTPDGTNFVPVQLYAPKSAGLAADAEVLFFGAIDREDGTRVAVVEEPVKLAASGGDVYYAHTMRVAPGSYVGTFGLAADGKPIALVSRPIVVKGIAKDEPGVSPLLLTTNLYPLTAAQEATDPFAFGGIKVVPRGNLTFRRSEELQYFFELRYPGIDPTTSQPNQTMRISVKGTTAEGRAVKMAGSPEPVQSAALNGVPGHWAVIQAMPLESFKPGTYTISVQLNDAVLNRTYDIEETFRVVE